MKRPTSKTRRQTEYGDFQTPLDFARRVCRSLAEQGLRPNSVLEPTCGRGSFLVAALERFATIRKAVGIEIDPESVRVARAALAGLRNGRRAEVRQGNFFEQNWTEILEALPEPLLIIGNPPWVTNSELGTIRSSNLPAKSNFQNHKGLEAVTGKANFDISEWMTIRCLEWMNGRRGVIALLCKAAVARRVLARYWRAGEEPVRADMYLIDSHKIFGAAAAGCVLVVDASTPSRDRSCRVYPGLETNHPSAAWAYVDNAFIADIDAYKRWKHLSRAERYIWRSGIKHDCVRIMEFTEEYGGLRNRMGEIVDLEPDYLYPMLKSSDLADARGRPPTRWLLVTQRSVGADTGEIRERAPKTWEYLCRHGDLLDRRASSIYRKRPRFSMFGVGDYSFSRWKVAVSGLYKNLAFKAIGPFRGRPVVLDDTCYFLPSRSRHEAQLTARLLNSEIAAEFFSAYVFRDAKRPITAEVLRRLDIRKLGKELGIEDEELRYLGSTSHDPQFLEDAKDCCVRAPNNQ
ncbi:MAG: N-6 DNA methylase [Desulfomonilaceae bacterium]|nr:N-6 DNA methylase [Desulfomonilaceae bacterium]